MRIIYKFFFSMILLATCSPLGAMDSPRHQIAQRTNFTHFPGRHTKVSPIAGSRYNELQKIRNNLAVFEAYQNEVYGKSKIRVIPTQFKERADAIAKEMFLNYIDKYRKFGANTENIVLWNLVKMTSTDVSDVENDYNTWYVEAKVAEPGSKFYVKDDLYSPPYLSAIHELMHVEEVEVGISQKEYNSGTGDVYEVLTVTKTLVLLDRVYKEVAGVSSEEEVDYGVTFELFGKQISQGKLAKFYGELEQRYENLAEALISAESLEFLGCSPDVPTKNFRVSTAGNPIEFFAYLSDVSARNNGIPSTANSIEVLGRLSDRPARNIRIPCTRKAIREQNFNAATRSMDKESQAMVLQQQFFHACLFGQMEKLEKLLQEVDDKYNFIAKPSLADQSTGLHMAAESGHLEIVKILLRIAVEANSVQDFIGKPDCVGRTALQLARTQKRINVVELLETYLTNLSFV